jgi:hypothetical protein
MYDERKLIGMYENKKILFKCFISSINIWFTLTTMQLGSLEPIYDIY